MDNKTEILVEKLSVHQTDKQILHDVSFAIEASQLVYLVGKVGSGKSSLIKTLYADLPIKDGSAHMSGYDIAKLNNKTRPLFRRRLGMVFQDFQLLNDRSVNDNLDFVLRATNWRKNRQKRIDEVLEKVEMMHKKQAMPYALSGGEFQRIAIARALLNNPDIILADEPTGNLDSETTQGIALLLSNLAKSGRIVFIVTHDMQLIKDYPGRVLKCENGLVSEITPAKGN